MALAAGRIILETRELLAQFFNVPDSSRIVFTANVTEALNLAIKGLLRPGEHVILSAMEHNAVCRPIWALAKSGVSYSIVPCNREGLLASEEVEKAIQPNTRLICINHASNLVGTIQPIREIGQIASGRRVPLLLDAAQTAGVLPIDVLADGVDLLAFTGHKALLGPPGTGGLYIRDGIELRPLKEGGTGTNSELLEQPLALPERFEAGTPNTPGIAGLGAGLRFLRQQGLTAIRRHECDLTRRLLEGLAAVPGISLYGPGDPEQRTAVIAFNLAGMDANQVSFALDQGFDIACRSGLHCAPLAHQTIGTLATGAVRLSPGWFNTGAEMDQVIAAVRELAAE